MQMHLKTAHFLAELLDSKFKIGGFRFGLDPIIGFIPFVGDLSVLVISVYILWIGRQMKVPEDKFAQMVTNVVVDTLMGFVPVVGDIGDFFFKANIKNLEIIKKHGQFVVEGELTQAYKPQNVAYAQDIKR